VQLWKSLRVIWRVSLDMLQKSDAFIPMLRGSHPGWAGELAHLALQCDGMRKFDLCNQQPQFLLAAFQRGSIQVEILLQHYYRSFCSVGGRRKYCTSRLIFNAIQYVLKVKRSASSGGTPNVLKAPKTITATQCATDCARSARSQQWRVKQSTAIQRKAR